MKKTLLEFLNDCLDKNLKAQEKALNSNNFTKYATLRIGEQSLREDINKGEKEEQNEN